MPSGSNEARVSRAWMREQLFVRFYEVTPFDRQTTNDEQTSIESWGLSLEPVSAWVHAIEREQLARVRTWGELLPGPTVAEVKR